MTKNKKKRVGVVYSTDPDYDYEVNETAEESLEPSKQKLRVSLDKKQRRGKQVSLITGFIGPESDLKDLAKILKTKVGVGGSAKDGEIVIQGDNRMKIKGILEGLGYQVRVI